MTGRRRGREEHCLAWLQKQVVLAIAVSGQAGGWRCGPGGDTMRPVYRHTSTTSNMCDFARAQSATENRFPRQTTPQARWGTTWVGRAVTAAASPRLGECSFSRGGSACSFWESMTSVDMAVWFASLPVQSDPYCCSADLTAVLTKGFRFSSRMQWCDVV